MKVAVLGAGPSGMIAAWAAINAGHSVQMFSDVYVNRHNYGVFFFHDSCDLPISGMPIKQMIVGNYGMSKEETAAAYGKMVYKNEKEGWGILLAYEQPIVIGYNPNEAMEVLKIFLSDMPKVVQVFSSFVEVQMLIDDFDKIICTIPAPAIFPEKKFPFVTIYVRQEDGNLHDNFFMNNVNPNLGWYRFASIFGKISIEYLIEQPLTSRVKKVIPGDLLPIDDNILFTGRQGAWDRRKRIEHVYKDALDFLQKECV